MTLDDFIKERYARPFHAGDEFKHWLDRVWKSAHAEGEKVGWHSGMIEAKHLFTVPYKRFAENIDETIDARKDK